MTLETDDSWPKPLTTAQGKRIRQRREELNLSPLEVVDQLKTVGMEMNRSTYTNMELGRRKAITVPEMFALAHVLRIPPALLMVPLSGNGSLEVLKDDKVEPWTALQWVTGSGILHQKSGSNRISDDGDDRSEFEEMLAQQEAISWHRFNDQLQFEIEALSQRENSSQDIKLKLEQLTWWRDKIRENDMTPPAVSEFIAEHHPDVR